MPAGPGEVEVYPLGYMNRLVVGREYDVIEEFDNGERRISWDGDISDIDSCTFYANPRFFWYAGFYDHQYRRNGAVFYVFALDHRRRITIKWQEDDPDAAPPCFREHRRRGRGGGSRRSTLRKKSRKQKTRRN